MCLRIAQLQPLVLQFLVLVPEHFGQLQVSETPRIFHIDLRIANRLPDLHVRDASAAPGTLEDPRRGRS